MASIEILAKWKSEEKLITMETSQTIGMLKITLINLFSLEGVKIVGLFKGKKEESVCLSELRSVTKALKKAAKKNEDQVARIKVMVLGERTAELAGMRDNETKFELERVAEELRLEEERKRFEKEAETARQQAEEERIRREVERKERELRQAERQREWRERKEQERADRLRREIEGEIDDSASVSLEFPCFVSPEATAADKILLPAQALQTIIDNKVAFPLTFQISPSSTTAMDIVSSSSSSSLDDTKYNGSNNRALRDQTYFGVLNFEAPTGMCMAPQQLFDQLGIQEGDQINLESVHLEKATFVQLQPVRGEWLDIPEIERKAVLEFELRKHQFLSASQKVVISYNMMDHELIVRSLVPDVPVVSIIDTDLAFEELTPIVPVDPIVSLDDKISMDHDSQFIEAEVSVGSSHFYSLQIDDENSATCIRVSPISGDPDLYISQDTCRPSMKDFTWASQTAAGTNEIILSQRDPLFSAPSTYYIAVRGFGSDQAPDSDNDSKMERSNHARRSSQSQSKKSDTTGDNLSDNKFNQAVGSVKYRLAVMQVDVNDLKEGHSMIGSPRAADTNNKADQEMCDNCRRLVPKRAMIMHQSQCFRRNFYCTKCQLVMPKNEAEKHNLLMHTPIKCRCGISLEQKELLVHKRDNCQFRRVPCIYCPLHVMDIERGAHQGECGNRPATCLECGDTRIRKYMFAHIARAHDKNIRELTFQDYY